MAYYSDPRDSLSYQNTCIGIASYNNANQFNSYGYSHVVPMCHICGIEGHAPAECQQRYASTQNCFGMNFAQQHGSYHNYSVGWPENQNVTYADNNLPISLFPPSYQMQGFRCGEENRCNSHQQCAAPTYASEFNQDQHQSSPYAEQSSSMAELKKKHHELMDMMNKQMMQMKASFWQTVVHEPQHQPQEPVPMELSDPPQVQPPKEVFDVPEQTSKSPTEAAAIEEGFDAEIEKEERSQILEEQDAQLECTSEEEAAIEEKEESEIQEDMHIDIQECAETGLSNPLDDMLATDFLSIVSHYLIPLLNVELNHDLLKSGNVYYAIDSAHDRIHVSHNPHAKIILENACLKDAHLYSNENCYPEYDTMSADPYHFHHVPYCYTYIIGYSIDDLVGASPVTSASCSLCEFIFRFSIVHHPLRPNMTRVDIPWDPGGFLAWW